MATTQTKTASATRELLEEFQKSQSGTKTKTAPSTATATVAKTDEKFANIENNTFYKIIFSKAEPEEKKRAVAEALAYKIEEGKEKNLESLKEFTLFKEYLQHERKLMAQEIIRMTDTGALSELKATIDDLNKGLLEFDERMSPLTQIIDAVFELRKAGGETVLGVFKEIKDDQEAEVERLRKLQENEGKLTQLESAGTNLQADVSVLENTKSGKYRKFFGFGGLKEETVRSIAEKKIALENNAAQVSSVATELETLRNPNTARETQFAAYAEQKAKLRELLDITSDEHKQRQKALVDAAQNFVVTTDQRVNSVLQHLDGMSGQIENLSEANNGMRKIYAVLEEASHEASDKNQALRQQLAAKPEGEGSIAQMTREAKLTSVEEHVTTLGNSTLETTKTFADLQTQGIRIKSMKDSNREQVSKTRELHSSGVAGVADRLSTVLQAVSAAALNESSEAAKMSVNTMNDKTNAVAMQESIRTAMGLKDVADGINRAIDDLKDYKDGMAVAQKIVRENREEILKGMQTVQKEAREVAKALNKAISSEADTDLSSGSAAAPASNDDTPAAPEAAPKKEGSSLGKFGNV